MHQPLNLALLAAFLLSGQPLALADTLWSENFNGNTAQTLSWQQLPLMQLVPAAGKDASQALQVNYLGYPRGSQRIVRNLPLLKPVQAAELSFALRFCPGFRFVRGGKLPGFGSLFPVTGGSAGQPDGWSVRLSFGAEGRLGAYVYQQQRKSRYGQHFWAEHFRFEPGRMYQLRLQLALNSSPALHDGWLKVFVGDQLVVAKQQLQLFASQNDRSAIHNLLFHTFHGGSSPDYAPKDAAGRYSTECAYFDDLTVRQQSGVAG